MKSLLTILLCVAALFAPVSGYSQSDDLAEKSRRAKEFIAEGKFADAVPVYRELNIAVPNNRSDAKPGYGAAPGWRRAQVDHSARIGSEA